ncbi:MAG TPA: TauD/TfdA family dioxygenase [Ktedonobacteraceae bacterium]|nr:TauD/TfdA family dioxygenase [Ktedonobacteraceae bacterium]
MKGSTMQPHHNDDLKLFKRKTINASATSLVKESYFGEDRYPLIIQPNLDGINLIDWVRDNKLSLLQRLSLSGALLFRGFSLSTTDEFERFNSAISDEVIHYHESSSPRTQIDKHVYTSTDYPADKSIFLHNELSYSLTFPQKITFLCTTPALTGGETPLASTRNIYNSIPSHIKDRFQHKGWMLIRNFGDGCGLPWQDAFHTTSKQEVEAYCQKNMIACEWKDGDRLRTRQVRPALARHPRTQEILWFNHLTFFHVSTREKEIQETLLRQFREEDLPTNTYYGDGSAIEPAFLDELRAIYERETKAFLWQENDILLLDNMLVAHGRAPFSGPRKVVVGMADPLHWNNAAFPENFSW